MKRFLISGIVICLFQLGAMAQIVNYIPVPDTLSGNAFELDMHSDSVQFFPGKMSYTIGYNSYSYMGPTLIFRKGNLVSIHVTNRIGDTSNVHWHGLHVSPSNDGGPHTMIMDGMDWTPSFEVMNRASTFWYHPHFHGKTALHAIKGAVGFILVRDSIEEKFGLPRKYGVDDFPVAIQSLQFDSLNQPMPRGMQDSTLLVNGVKANIGSEAVLKVPAQFVRLRLLNGSGERTFNIGLDRNRPFYVIGSDGGLLSAPVQQTRIRISPGERYEILLDLSGLTDSSVHVKSYASELPMGVQGGPTMPMPPGNPPMDSPLNGVDFNLFRLEVGHSTTDPITLVPQSFQPVIPISEQASKVTRKIKMTAPSVNTMDGPFYFNDSTYNMERIDYRIPLGNTEIWEITNQTMVAHPFHIHDVQFFVLDRDGNPTPAVERGMKDVVLIQSMETVRFIASFGDFTDTIVPYVYHCHILMHEDDGMMGQFLVVPANSTGFEESIPQGRLLKIYPVPSSDNIAINLPGGGQAVNYEITDILGRTISKGVLGESGMISVEGLDAGVYTLVAMQNNKVYSGKFIKN